MTQYTFNIKKQSIKNGARLGELITPHGIINTPVFMPVGTQATVKSLTPEQLLSTNSQILLANTYHLSLRPGIDVIKQHGGLHSMMNWQKPILTDSGGYQVFSLSKRRQVDAHGITFQSHINGDKARFTPKHVIDLQCGFNSDIMMVLDICTAYGESKSQTAQDLLLTHNWAQDSNQYWLEKQVPNWCFAIVQGGFYMDLRKESAEFLTSLNFPGYAIGGLSVGEPKDLLHDYIANCAPLLPQNKPRYVMGIGLPENIKLAIENGIDMFDCVIPTRIARHGQFFYEDARINIKKEIFKNDLSPLSDTCSCYTCQHFSKSYIRHLFIAKEILASTLLTIHNIHFLNNYVEILKADMF
ncbi:tRNA guanosine(34) transglycosylase Tgt [bacterium]|nr:tRNA guanosine(34) transglycosylase Tgt [bacterium]